MKLLINKTVQVEVNTLTFNGGELQVKLGNTDIREGDVASITTRLTSASSIMELMLVVDALRRIQPNIKVDLNCAYFPYARQDRVCDQGEALSVSVATNIINSLHLNRITVTDAHSDVTTALLNNVTHKTQIDVIADYKPITDLLSSENTTVLAPDAGASKKAMTLASKYQSQFVQALKKRSIKTGRIEYTQICGDIQDRDIFIADDICDGGATFIALAKSLREKGAKSITLFVTHGIFANGIAPLAEYIDNIYTTDSFRDARDYENHPSLNVISL